MFVSYFFSENATNKIKYNMFLSGNLLNDLPDVSLYIVSLDIVRNIKSGMTYFPPQRDILGFSHLNIKSRDRKNSVWILSIAEQVAGEACVFTCEMEIITYLSIKYNMGLKFDGGYKAFVKIQWAECFLSHSPLHDP